MQHAVLTDDILRSKALDYATKLGLTNFQASANWVLHFKQRHGIDQKVRHGEAGSADHTYVHIAQAGIPLLLRDVSQHDQYNMDETGVNFRTLPKESLATVAGKGYVASKDRLTAVLCVNATGTHKLNLMIIGSAVKPRCFGAWQPERDGKVLYAGNKTSWMNSKEFVRWIDYFNGEMSARKKTGWLLMDNCSTH